MKYKSIIDTHTHSVNSFDGHHTCHELCKGIIENGGIGIAITDHCDIDGLKREAFESFEKQYNEVEKAKKVFDSIKVYNREVIVKQKQSRWSVGMQGGVGMTPKGLQPYIGIGIGYLLK